MRAVAILCGVVLLAAATWYTIDSTGYAGAHMLLICALAVGTVGGAIVLGRAKGRWALLVVPAVFMGELSGAINTAERLLKVREQSAGVVIGAQSAAKAREARIADARAALEKHDAKAPETSASKTCAENCAKMLMATRAELQKALDKAEALPIDAEANRSVSPLADRLGIAPWLLDLIQAAAITLGANGLSLILIAWGAHSPANLTPTEERRWLSPFRRNSPAKEEKASNINAAKGDESPEKAGEYSPRGNVTPFKRPRPAPPLWGKFALEALEPDDGSRVAVKDVVAAYRGWLEARGAPVPPAAELVDHIERVFRAARIRTEAQDATIYALNVKVAAKAG